MKRHSMPELISVRPHLSPTVENRQHAQEKEEGTVVPLL